MIINRRFSSGLLQFTVFVAFSLLGAIALSACVQNSKLLQHKKAKNIYLPAHMAQVTIANDLFPFVLFERVNGAGEDVTVYISAPFKGSADNPTPYRQTVLKMAATDKLENVIYIAPPCAFLTNEREGYCPDKYLTTNRYSDRVIHAYRKVLDKYISLYSLDGVHLIGHSGGAAIASLLAERHPKVKSLRTVAGVLNTKMVSGRPFNSDLSGSLNPAENTLTLSGLPQHHFLGTQDTLVSPEVLDSYVQAIGLSRCVRTSLIPDAGHYKGWADKWSELMKRPVDCNVPNILLDIEEEKRALPPLEPIEEDQDLPESADKPLTPENAKFLTFFDFDSSKVKDSAREVLKRIVDKVAENETLDRLKVVGHADTSGPESYNKKLGLQRAKAIKDVLTNMGLDSSQISISSKGETELLVPTKDDVREPSNRRVEIMFE